MSNLIIMSIYGCFCGYISKKNGINFWIGFAIGFVLGILGIPVVYLIKNKSKENKHINVEVDKVSIEKNEENSKLNEIVSNLTIESTVKVTGTLLKNEKVKLNKMELIPNNIIVTSKCLSDLPLNYKDSKSALLDTRLNYRFLDLRSEKNILMFKVQTCMINAMREFVVKNNFTEIHTPKIISTASESGADVFEVKYFDRKAYLAQSPQFYKQMAMCSGFEKVFEIAPAFRAENSNTNRHTTEFTSFDLGNESYRTSWFSRKSSNKRTDTKC